MPSMNKELGFTLIELLVVIAIIGMFASIILTSLNKGREKARIAQLVGQIHEIQNVAGLYITDTGIESFSCDITCTSDSDPFLNSLGVTGWDGPYIPGGLWNLEHPWGGHLTISNNDITGDSILDFYIQVDDDAPGTSIDDNSGLVPSTAATAIDRALDDGDLETGNLRGDGAGFMSVPGELFFLLMI